jgi:hypothetical protein
MISEEVIGDVLVLWEEDGGERVPVAFFNNGDQEATVKAWRRDGGLEILTVWLTLPRTRCWRVKDHVDPLPFGKYRVDVRTAEVLWWTDSVTASKLAGQNGSSMRSRHNKVLRTARIVIG